MRAHKYLTRHAEPEAQALTLDAEFDFVLVLPCYDEALADIQRLAVFCTRHRALLILVVNQPDTVNHCQNNSDVITWANHQQQHNIAQHVSFCLVDNNAILLIDRTQQRIPAAQGVGLARKIGADCAFALITQQKIHCAWIFSTDADATLPHDYFSAVQPANTSAPITNGLQTNNNSAVIFPFAHMPRGDTSIDTATALYELRINDYVAGLRRANSPYAFHTIGSTLAINAQHYAAAHGFPKRAGGEDFYLLNKLVKLAPVTSLAAPCLQLQSRTSHRVPFGTGPATRKLAESTDMFCTPLFYDPRSFDALKHWLDFMRHCAQEFATTDADTNNWQSIWKQSIWNQFFDVGIADPLQAFIDCEEFSHTLVQAKKHCKTSVAFTRYLNAWFDGFRTLKLLHGLRDAYFPLLDFRSRFGKCAANPQDLLIQLEAMNQHMLPSHTHTSTLV